MKNILKPIFWDVDLHESDVKKHAFYIIERVLEFGDLEQINWIMRRFSTNDIIKVLKTSRRLSLKSANFWANYYNVPKSEVKCLTESFQKAQKNIWPY